MAYSERSSRPGDCLCSDALHASARSPASGAIDTEGKRETAWNDVEPMLDDLASSLAARDPATAAHCTRVTFLSRRLAGWLGWDERQLQTVEVGAPLLDIGKVTISEALLRKRGPLLPHELAEIRTHPAAGAKLISPIGPARDALPYVLYHHEHWDGGGYPTGRRGTQIPEGARLLAV